MTTSGEGEEVTRPTSHRGLESEVLLARARTRMLGMPTPATVGRYRVIEKLGAGGMGVVFSARDDELDRNVAIKILRGDLAGSGGGRQRLVREAQAMAKLSHPNVVHVYEVGHHGDQVFLAMEYIAGHTLRVWCEQEGRSWREILAMHLQAGAGLAAAHEAGLIHRDYKMDNVLVGNDERPRVLDFGLARPECDASTLTDLARVEQLPPPEHAEVSDHGGPSLTMTGVAMGTPAYMAPEQLLAERIDARVDQFAFCVSLYEALYGRRPFPGSTMTQLIEATRTDKPLAVDPRRYGVPRELHEAILKGLRRDRTERHASMAALIDALRRPLHGRTDRRRARALGLGAGLLAVGIAGAVAMQRSDAPTTEAATDVAPDRVQAILDASDLPPLQPTPLPGDPTGVTVHRLANGLTVYIAPQPGEPHIDTKIVVRADASDEAVGHAGIANLALATMAMGSTRIGTLDYEAEKPFLDKQLALLDQLADTTDPEARAKLVAEVDAAYRASAHLVVPHEALSVGSALGFSNLLFELHLHSVLAATVPRNRFATWAELWAEPLRDPVLRGFATVVSEDVERARETAEYTQPFIAARRHLAAADGIHSDVAMAFEHARTFPHREVLDFLDRYYRPNNTAIVLVGDITAVEALPVLERAFGGWEPAELPAKEWIDRPLPKGPIVEEITDAGPPAAMLAFPLPPPDGPDRGAFEALGKALAGQDGLLANLLVPAADAAWTEAFIEDRTLFLVAMTRPGQAPVDAERALRKAIDDIAAGNLPDEVWAAAIARQELEATRWATSPSFLAETIATSFAQRREWADVAEELGRPATREELAAAARTLVERGAVAVHAENGPAYHLEGDAIAIAPPQAPPGRHSQLAEQLLARPAAELEPQFLAPGRDYQTFQYGAGRIVVAPEDTPLFRLSWSWPIGVDREPLACDALRAKVDSRHRWPGLRGLEIQDSCASNLSRIEVVGVDARFEEVWPALRAFLSSHELPIDAAEAHLAELMARRDQARQDPYAKLEALHAFALRGEHSIDAQMPRDAALRELDPRKLVAALERVQSVDPDIAYVGPRQQLLLEHLPEASRVDAPRDPIRFRELARTTVFVLDDPGRPDAYMRVSVPVPDVDQASVLAEVFEQFMHGEPENLGEALTVYPLGPRGVANGRIAHHVEVRASASDAVHGLEIVLARLRRPPTTEAFARAHKRAEAAYRAARTAPRSVPLELQRWIDRGWDRDPKFANWLALASLDLPAFTRYAESAGATPIAIAIVADLSQLDRGALAKLGDVVEIDPAALLRDPGISDIYVVDTMDDCNCMPE